MNGIFRILRAGLHASGSSSRLDVDASPADCSVVTLAVLVEAFLFVSYRDVSRRQAKGDGGAITVIYIDELIMTSAPVIERAEGEVWKTANSNKTAKIICRRIAVKTPTIQIMRIRRKYRGIDRESTAAGCFQLKSHRQKYLRGSRTAVRLRGEMVVLDNLLGQLVQVR